MKKLSEIGIGKIVRIQALSEDDIHLPLMEMGCIPGELVEVKNCAAMGGPMAIIVAGYSLGLRLNEADSIFVEEI